MEQYGPPKAKPAVVLTAAQLKATILRALRAQVDDCQNIATQARTNNNTMMDSVYTTIADTLASLADRIGA